MVRRTYPKSISFTFAASDSPTKELKITPILDKEFWTKNWTLTINYITILKLQVFLNNVFRPQKTLKKQE
jgi:hypothetical protein